MSVPTRAALAVLGVAAVSCALVGAASSPAFAAPGNGKNALAGSVPPWAQAAHKVGASDKSTQVDFRVYLSNRGGDAAQRLAGRSRRPGTPSTGKFLTAAQYRAQFSPAQADVDAVSAWLKAQGFTVGDVPDNHKYVEAIGLRGPGGQSAFGTSFSDYTVDGHDAALQRHAAAGPEQPRVRRGGHRPRRVHGAGPPGRQDAAVRRLPDRPSRARRTGAEKTVAEHTDPGRDNPAGLAQRVRPVRVCRGAAPGRVRRHQASPPATTARGVTVAVIDAYASPTAASDLNDVLGRARPARAERALAPGRAPGTYNRSTQPRSRTRLAGPVRRPSTSRRSTPWLRARTSSTSARRTTTGTSTRP